MTVHSEKVTKALCPLSKMNTVYKYKLCNLLYIIVSKCDGEFAQYPIYTSNCDSTYVPKMP